MPVDNLCWLDQPLQRDLVGDKAFYLGLLRQNHQPILPGVVVVAPVLQQFLLRVNWQEQLLSDLPEASLYVNANQPRQLQAIAQQIRQAILTTPLPETLLDDLQQAVAAWPQPAVIFRASLTLQAGLDPALTAKTQGLLESYPGYSDRESLELGLKQAWAELFRAKSLLYWQRLGIQLPQINLAVLVQPLQDSRAAGTLKIAGSQIEIQAVWGLGQTLNLGEADCYSGDLQQGWQSPAIAQKRYAYGLAQAEADSAAQTSWLPEPQACLRLEYIAAERQQQPVLEAKQLQALSALAQQAEATLKTPLILEWLLRQENNGSGFQLTQAIPQAKMAFRAPPLSRLHRPPAALPEASSTRLSGLAAAPGRAVAIAWVLEREADWTTALEGMPAGAILVTAALTPEQIIRLRQVGGFVTEQGGITSHAAILARELRIPAVVGVEQARQQIKTGDWLAIDGELGELYRSSLPFVELPSHWLAEGQSHDQSHGQSHDQSHGQSHMQVPSLQAGGAAERAWPDPDLKQPQLWLSLSQLDHLAEAAAAPVSGVGLLRSELMLLDLFGQQHPEVWLRQQPASRVVAQIAARIRQFAAAFAPRPLFYRALDIQAEPGQAESGRQLPQSMGLRGALRMQLHPDLLQIELAALRQVQQDYENLALLLPFVRTVEEFSFCRQQVEQAGLLRPGFQLWMMAEVPSVLFLLPDYQAAGLQGIAIGVNDLTQLLLGVDRDQPQMSALFNPGHPAVLRALQHLIQQAKALKLPCSICGQSFRQQPALLQALLDWQITAVSVDLSEVNWVAEAMRRAAEQTR